MLMKMRFVFLVYVIISIFLLQSDRVAYAISRLYEGCFVYLQYNYLGIEKEGFHKELTYQNKILCKESDYTPEMALFLHGPMKRKDEKLLSKRKRKETYKIDIAGKEYVVKSHTQRGAFKNLFQMGKAVTIWNNLMWAEEKGIPLQEPVAFVEKRKKGKVITHVLYRYEGKGVNYVILEDKKVISLINNAIASLEAKQVIHPDLRARNMIYIEDQGIKFIDTDILHYYPKWSLIYNKRMKEEKRLFKEDCPAYDTDS